MWSRHDQHHLGPRLWRLCAMGLISTWLAACWPHKPEPSTPEPTGLEVIDRMPETGRAYHRNPDPKQGWRLQVKVENAPGPLVMMRSGVGVFIHRNPCLPPPNTNPMGVSTRLSSGMSFPMERLDENTYSGVFFSDWVLDEDYFGRGLCRWQFESAGVFFMATGAEGETQYIANIGFNELDDGLVKRLYYTKTAYPENPRMAGDSKSGYRDPNRYRPELRDDLFTITLSLEALRP